MKATPEQRVFGKCGDYFILQSPYETQKKNSPLPLRDSRRQADRGSRPLRLTLTGIMVSSPLFSSSVDPHPRIPSPHAFCPSAGWEAGRGCLWRLAATTVANGGKRAIVRSLFFLFPTICCQTSIYSIWKELEYWNIRLLFGRAACIRR